MGACIFFISLRVVILKMKYDKITFWFVCTEPMPGDTLLDVPENLQRNIDQGSVTAPQDRCDVIMLVKQFIGSENLAQRPLLVLTAGRSNRVDLVPTVKHPSCRKRDRNHPNLSPNQRNLTCRMHVSTVYIYIYLFILYT